MGINLSKGESINLSKDERIDLSKSNGKLEQVAIGLGWDVSERYGNVDIDASVILQGEKNKDVDLIYYGNLSNSEKTVIHTGDNLTGEGEGDDEVILLKLNELNRNVKKIHVVVNIYNASVDFSKVENAFVRIINVNGINGTNFNSINELVRYNLTDNYAGMIAIHVAELTRINDNEWGFTPNGTGTTEKSVSQIVKNIKKA